MTTVAYSNGMIAADTLVTVNSVRTGFMTKIAKNSDVLAGFSGEGVFGQAFLKCVTEGGELPKVPEGSVGFTVDKAGAVTSYEENGSCMVQANCFAIGSGREMALAAMAAGADPQKAVEIAIDLDVYSGGSIDVLRIPLDAPKKPAGGEV